MVAPLLFLVATILIVSVTYIIVSARHKEKMMIMEKGLDANFFDDTPYFLDILKWGVLLLGMGVGFLSAFTIDTLVFDRADGTEALYPSLTSIGGGISLVLFYTIFRKRKK